MWTKKNGGYESLARLEAKTGSLRNGVISLTGGGGMHILFEWPKDGTIVTNSVNLKGDYPGLDVRGQRGYVVLPPGLHKSGKRYAWKDGHDPESVELAQAPQAFIEIIKNAGNSRTYADKPRDTRPWDSVPDEIIREKAPSLCARIGYFTTEQGALDVSYEDWIALASWAHAMTDNSEVFQEWSAVDSDRYNKRDTGRKWRDTADMAPRSCHRAQSDHPLPECAKCPFYDMDKNPALIVREAYNHQLGQSGPFGAPPPTQEELEERRLRRQNEQDARMNSLLNDSERKTTNPQPKVESTGTDGAPANAPVIDVTEDEEAPTAEPSTSHSSSEEPKQQPNFRLATDNIKPRVERNKELVQKLKDGTDPFEIRDEAIQNLAEIRKLDKHTYGVERDRLVIADKDSAKKHKRSAYFTAGKVDDGTRAALELELAEIQTKQATVGEVWPDAPEEHHELPLPSGYKYSEDGVERFISTAQGGFGFEDVSSQPTYVSGWREDIVTGEIAVVLRTRTRNRGWVEVSSQPSDLEDKRATSALRNVGCDFSDSVSFGKYLLGGYSLIRTKFGIEPELGTTRLGWHEVDERLYFVFPEQSFGDMPIHLHGNNQQLEQDLSVKGDIWDEREALVEHMVKYPKVAFAVGTAAASILMRPAKTTGLVDLFGFCTEYVSAQTGTGKSTTVSAAISIYGAPYSVRNFQMTQFAATQSMILRSDLPNVWQEAQAGNQAGKGNNADPGMLLHVLGDGGGKLIGTKGGGLRHNPQIFGTMLLANNENFVNPSTAKQGELQRVFTFDPPFPNPHDETRTKEETQRVKKDQEKLMQELSNNHGNGGRQMVRKLIETVDGSWSKLCEKVDADYRVQYEASSKAITADMENYAMFDRRAKIVALVRVGLKYLIEYGYDLPEGVTDILFHGIEESFEELIDNEIEQKDDKVLDRRALQFLSDELARDGSRVAGLRGEIVNPLTDIPHGGWIGGRKEVRGIDCIAFNKTWLTDFLASKGLQAGVLYKEWQRQKITVCAVKAKDKDGNPVKYHLTSPIRPDWMPTTKDIDHICVRAEALGYSDNPEMLPETTDDDDI